MSIIHVVSYSTGKDSQATLNVAIERFGTRNVRPIFIDTDNEDKAVHKHLEYTESVTGIPITRLKADFSDQMEVHRQRLLAIKDGAPDYHPQAKYPWTPERAAQAAEQMHPTGNAFLDLCMIKGMFPSHSRQFCTEELKRDVAVEYQLDLIDAGHTVVSWQGVRRDESKRRADVVKFEKIAPRLYAYRPIIDWSAEQVFAYIRSKGQKPNSLYKRGMTRVGCMPCINVNKDELKQIALRFPEHIERIAKWEQIVKSVSRAGMASFLHTGKAGGTDIWERVEWSKTTRGGRQYSLLTALEEPTACASAYGLCE
jgi:3'-phosphoadenosine 5'-phosphosulfate sulfotransferase (PAPS reductase)/FAD synthetase